MPSPEQKTELRYVVDEFCEPSPPDDPQYPTISQVQLVGNPFPRDVAHGTVVFEGEEQYLPHIRTVRIIGSNGNDGNEFDPLTQSSADPAHLPKISLEYARRSRTGQIIYDAADDAPGKSLERARKKRASTKGFNVQQKWEKAGAIPGYRIPKRKESFRSPIVGEKIERSTSDLDEPSIMIPIVVPVEAMLRPMAPTELLPGAIAGFRLPKRAESFGSSVIGKEIQDVALVHNASLPKAV